MIINAGINNLDAVLAVEGQNFSSDQKKNIVKNINAIENKEGVISESHIGAKQVSEGKLADGAVTRIKLASGANVPNVLPFEDSTKIADGKLTAEHFGNVVVVTAANTTVGVSRDLTTTWAGYIIQNASAGNIIINPYLNKPTEEYETMPDIVWIAPQIGEPDPNVKLVLPPYAQANLQCVRLKENKNYWTVVSNADFYEKTKYIFKEGRFYSCPTMVSLKSNTLTYGKNPKTTIDIVGPTEKDFGPTQEAFSNNSLSDKTSIFCAWYLTPAIDLTHYKKLHCQMELQYSAKGWNVAIGLLPSSSLNAHITSASNAAFNTQNYLKKSDNKTYYVATQNKNKLDAITTAVIKTFTIDISDCSGFQYIGGEGTGDFRIQSIYLTDE